MHCARIQLFLAAVVLVICVGLAAAAINVGKPVATVVALAACLVSFYLLLCSDEFMLDALDAQDQQQIEGQFME